MGLPLQLLLLPLQLLLLMPLQLLLLMPLLLLLLMLLLNASKRWTDSADKCQSSPSVTLLSQDVSPFLSASLFLIVLLSPSVSLFLSVLLSPSVSPFLSVLLFQDQFVKQYQGMLLPPSATPSP